MNAIQSFYTKYVKRWVKALAAAVGGALAGLAINWIRGTTPIPTTQNEWQTLLIATLLPPILAVFSPANKITQRQLDKDPNVVGGIVVETPPQPKPPISFQAPQEGYSFPAEGGYPPNPFG